MSPSGASWSPRAANSPTDALDALTRRHGLTDEIAGSLIRLLEALAAEPDPPTTVREPDLAVERHVGDSLAGLEIPELRAAGRVADLGSGAGFPGLVLAAALPAARVDLVEATARKCRVIERLAAAAGLGNVDVVAERAETWAAGAGREAYGAVTVRAVAPLSVLFEYASPLLELKGVLVAWKGGRDPEEESAAAAAAEPTGLTLDDPLAVRPFPGAHSRHLHVARKAGPTPPGLPRRPGRALKRPLGA